MLLDTNQLSVYYGRQMALEDVTLSMDSRTLGLLGPNGAGKSTLIRALLGLVPIHSGSARLEGLDVHSEGKRIRELIGYMPEHESYLAGMTAVRFLRFMGEMCGLTPTDAMERAHETLYYVGLGEARYRPLENLSYGLQQKVRLAQALIHGPKILILDEPTNGLDPTAREEMLQLIEDMISNSGSKVIVSSHLLRDIEICCHDVMVLNKGRVVATGNIEEMKKTDDNNFELRIKGDVDRYMASLSDLGCQCRLGDREQIHVSTPNSLSSRTFFELAHAQGAQVRHFYARRDTLEDIFIKVLEEDNSDSEFRLRNEESSDGGLQKKVGRDE